MVLVLTLASIGGGCASIVKGTTQAIPVSSSPSRASVYLDGNKVGQTPLSVEVKRKRDHLMTIEKPGYQNESIAITRNVGGAVFGNILAGGFIGWGVDAMSGAQYNLTPQTISVTLDPLGKGVSANEDPSSAVLLIEGLRNLDRRHEAKELSDEEYAKQRVALMEKHSPDQTKSKPSGLYENSTPDITERLSSEESLEFVLNKESAESGDMEAQFNLGNNYALGEGTKKNSVEAVKWYRMAAEQGYAPAQANLAYMYSKGKGLPKDYIQAHVWWNIASIQGMKKAKESLTSIEKIMTAEQIATAMELAKVKFEKINK